MQGLETPIPSEGSGTASPRPTGYQSRPSADVAKIHEIAVQGVEAFASRSDAHLTLGRRPTRGWSFQGATVTTMGGSSSTGPTDVATPRNSRPTTRLNLSFDSHRTTLSKARLQAHSGYEETIADVSLTKDTSIVEEN